MSRTYYPYILLLCLLQTLAVFAVAQQPLFWDNVLLTGKIPTDLWQHGLLSLYVKEHLAGYSPLWGAYIAQGWLWFGRSLLVTHMLMLPLLWLLSFQLVRLVQLFIPRRALGLSILGMASVPVLAALSVQCGPDLAVVALYLTALNAILQRNRGWLLVSLLPLALVSPRGLWCLVPLFILDQLLLGKKLFQPRWLWALSRSLAFMPAVLAGMGWYVAQYVHYGWVFNNPTGDFATLAQYTTLAEYLWQLCIAGWRMADMGQAIIWLGLMATTLALVRGQAEPAEHRPVLILLLMVPSLAFAFFFAAFRNPIGHRYMLIPVLMGVLWLCYEWAMQHRYHAFVTRMLVLLTCFWTGHLWVVLYPGPIAKGWDATLLHLQAGAAKRAMLPALQALPPSQRAALGAQFPDADPWQDAFLDTSTLVPVPVRLATNKALLYTNASNDWPTATYDSLATQKKIHTQWLYWPIKYQLWQ